MFSNSLSAVFANIFKNTIDQFYYCRYLSLRVEWKFSLRPNFSRNVRTLSNDVVAKKIQCYSLNLSYTYYQASGKKLVQTIIIVCIKNLFGLLV